MSTSHPGARCYGIDCKGPSLLLPQLASVSVQLQDSWGLAASYNAVLSCIEEIGRALYVLGKTVAVVTLIASARFAFQGQQHALPL